MYWYIHTYMYIYVYEGMCTNSHVSICIYAYSYIHLAEGPKRPFQVYWLGPNRSVFGYLGPAGKKAEVRARPKTREHNFSGKGPRRKHKVTLLLQGPQQLPTLWSHIPNIATVPYTSTVPQTDFGNHTYASISQEPGECTMRAAEPSNVRSLVSSVLESKPWPLCMVDWTSSPYFIPATYPRQTAAPQQDRNRMNRVSTCFGP